MADQRPPSSSDWIRMENPDGKAFYFNSSTRETSWFLPPSSPPGDGAPASRPALQPQNANSNSYGPQPSAFRPAQNNGPPPMSQNQSYHAASPTSLNSHPYPSHPASPTSYFSHPSGPANAYPPQQATFSPPAYASAPVSPVSNPYHLRSASDPEKPRSFSLRSAFKNAVKESFLHGFPIPQQSGNTGNAQGPGSSSAAPFSGMMSSNDAGQVIVNGRPLDQMTLMRQRTMGVNIVPGSYWYDSRCGAWGMQDGPCLGVIQAGQNLGGPLASNASGPSSTGLYINGRQIHALDYVRFQALGIKPIPGNWWMNADGSYGLVAMPFITVGKLSLHGMGSGGSGAHSWSTRMGNFGGEDGQGFGYVSGTDSSGNVWSVTYDQ